MPCSSCCHSSFSVHPSGLPALRMPSSAPHPIPGTQCSVLTLCSFAAQTANGRMCRPARMAARTANVKSASQMTSNVQSPTRTSGKCAMRMASGQTQKTARPAARNPALAGRLISILQHASIASMIPAAAPHPVPRGSSGAEEANGSTL